MTDRRRYPRAGCCVPFCRRTSTLFAGEWLCGDHWRLVCRALKLLRTRLRRRYERNWRTAESQHAAAMAVTRTNAREPGVYRAVDLEAQAGTAARCDRLNVAWRRTEAAIWRRMKRQAIERAGAIG